ncbi:hypothetical protein DPMN_132825 [Dreissena polymorpha]|uniref:Uncharacterized protein n=1 Tax=Dreissena polymorpha TaxID=45954 RepID=A0A9D4FWP4_DREPO|nr:hypothetical protein DPMN_132825 [Dreissena polymorpha]
MSPSAQLDTASLVLSLDTHMLSGNFISTGYVHRKSPSTVRCTTEFIFSLPTMTVSPGPTQTPRGACMYSLVTAVEVSFTVSYMYTV